MSKFALEFEASVNIASLKKSVDAAKSRIEKGDKRSLNLYGASATSSLNSYSKALSFLNGIKLQINSVTKGGVEASEEEIALMYEERAIAESLVKTLGKYYEKSNMSYEAKGRQIRASEAYKKSLKEQNKEIEKNKTLTEKVVDGYDQFSERLSVVAFMFKAMQITIQKVNESVEIAKNLNAAFTDIQMVTLGTTESIRELRTEYSALAYSLSTSLESVAKGSSEWMRQGKTAAETADLLTASMVMSKVGNIDAAESTTLLTSALNGYKIEAKDAMGVVDAMSQIDVKSASSVEDLAVAMQRSANSANMAGVSFNKLIGYIGAVKDVTQKSAESVGESMKTLFSRIGSVKAGTFLSEDLSAEYENFDTFINDTEKVLSKVGIRLRDTNQTFRDTEVVIDEVAASWYKYSDLEKNAIATAISGVRQREAFVALMENYGKATDLTTEAINSQGSAMEKYTVYQESIAATQGRIQALTETFISNMDLEGLIQQFLSVLEVVLKLFSSETTAKITKFAIAIGMLVPLIKSIRAASTGLSVGGFAAGFLATPVIGKILAVTSAVVVLLGVLDKLIVTQKELRTELIRQQQEIGNTKDELVKYEDALKANESRIISLNALKNAGMATSLDNDELSLLESENRELERNIILSREKLKIADKKAKEVASDLYKKSGAEERGITHADQSVMYDASDAIGYYKAQKEMAIKQADELSDILIAGVDENGKKLSEAEISSMTRRFNLMSVKADSWEKLLIEQVSLGEGLLPDLVGEDEQAMSEALNKYYSEVSSMQEKISEAFEDDKYLVGIKDRLTELANSAPLTAEAIKSSFPELSAIFRRLGLNVNDVAEYFNRLATEVHGLGDAVEKSYLTIYSEVEGKVSSIIDAQNELSSSGMLSAKTIAELGKEFSNLDEYLIQTDKGYTLTKGSLESLLSSQRDMYRFALNEAKAGAASFISDELGKAVAANATTEALKAQLRAHIALEKGKIYSDPSSRGHHRKELNALKPAEDAIAELEGAEKNYSKFEDIVLKLQSKGAPAEKSNSASKTKSETAYEKDIRNMEHKLYLSQQLGDTYKDDGEKYKEYKDEIANQSAILLKLESRVLAEEKALRKKGLTDESEKIQSLQKAWWGYYSQRKDLAKGLSDAEKKFAGESKKRTEDSLSTIKTSMSALMSDEKERVDELVDSYDKQISKLEAIKKLTEDYYDITNRVNEQIASINSELAVSKESYKYMDEELRKTIFNEEDYKMLSEKLLDIANSSSEMYASYMSELDSLSEDEIYKAEYITSEFEHQYQYKQKEYDIANKELELVKAQTELQNVMSNRNVRMYKDGQWSWVADRDSVMNATKNVEEAKSEVEASKLELKQQIVIDEYDKMISSIKLQSDAAKSEYELLADAWKNIEGRLTTQASTMEILMGAINGNDIPTFREIINSVGNALSGLIGKLTGGAVSFAGIGGGSSGGGGIDFSGNQGLEDLLGSNDANRYLQNKVDYGNAIASGNKEKADALNKENAALRDKYSVGKDTITIGDAKEALGYDSGGILKGFGGIKATKSDEVVFNGNTSAKLLSPEKSRAFLDSSKALNAILDNPATLANILSKVRGIVSGGSSSDSHDIYFNGDLLGKMAPTDSTTISSIMRRYIPLT